jgi:hypothetical protein
MPLAEGHGRCAFQQERLQRKPLSSVRFANYDGGFLWRDGGLTEDGIGDRMAGMEETK